MRRASSPGSLLFAPIAAALFAVLVATTMAAPAVRAGTPTTTTLEVPANAVYGPFTIVGHVRPAPQPNQGYIPALGLLVNGVLNAAAPLDTNGDGSTQLNLPPGTYEIVATFGPFGEWDASQSAPATVTVGVATQVQLASSLNPALSSDTVTITATVVPSDPGLSGGTLSIVDAFDGSTIASGPVGGDTLSVSVGRRFAAGSHVLTASYSGDGAFGPSEASLTQVSEADAAVLASGLGIQYSTFYPVKDGYRDTVAIRGILGETARVQLEIRNASTNKLVRSVDLATRAAGAYSWAWNGRNASGALLAAAKYKVVQRLTDTVGNKKAATFYVNLSHRKVTWYTHTITKYGDQYGATGDPGSGYVSQSKSSYGRGVRISSGTSWAGVRYTFALRTATVYKPLTFKVLGRSPNGTEGWGGLWNRTYGSAANGSSYDLFQVGPAYKWYSKAFDPTAHRSGRTTYGEVLVVWDGYTELFDIAKVQLTYRYGVLR